MLWRQGDIYIENVASIPTEATQLSDPVLAEGEATGHRHRIEDVSTASIFDNRGSLFLNVTADFANVVHDEHGTIRLPRGEYRVWRQREYQPSGDWQRSELVPPRDLVFDDEVRSARKATHVSYRYVID